MDENIFGSSLDDIDYTAPAPKKGEPAGISAPVLDDFEYVAPTGKKGAPTEVTAPVLDDMDYYTPPPSQKKGAPTGVSAPVLDDMGDYTPPPSQKNGAPTGVSAPVLDDNDVPYQADEPEVLVMTDEEIIEKFSADQLETYNRLPDANKQKVLDLMRKQFGAVAPPEPPVEVTAPVLDEDNYTPPPKPEIKEEPVPEAPVTAPILDEAPEPPKYKPKFVDEDLERAKREGAKQAVSSQLVSDQKDSKESLRMMLELKEERRREEAKKGFKWVIALAVVGLIGAVAFYLLYTGSLGLAYKDGIDGFAGIIKDSALYITIAMGATSLALVSGIGFFKSLASLAFAVSGIIQIFPGSVMIAQHEGSLGLAIALYIVSIVCTIAVFAGLSAVESVSLYFRRKEL
ncbi:MAG: ABC transporter permease [Ruminococcus flavefaciens]|nr:ABC transporter permease [Ruminococcus flavefaciens]MCM1230355.1 ABC transporter permease [Ruminococcus flavefaciens]